MSRTNTGRSSYTWPFWGRSGIYFILTKTICCCPFTKEDRIGYRIWLQLPEIIFNLCVFVYRFLSQIHIIMSMQLQCFWVSSYEMLAAESVVDWTLRSTVCLRKTLQAKKTPQINKKGGAKSVQIQCQMCIRTLKFYYEYKLFFIFAWSCSESYSNQHWKQQQKLTENSCRELHCRSCFQHDRNHCLIEYSVFLSS